jgi:hypothetical protein
MSAFRSGVGQACRSKRAEEDRGRGFPSPETIAALKDSDIVVACVDTFRAREAINAFCRRYLIPLIDIGMIIRTQHERLVKADGQVIVSLPATPACGAGSSPTPLSQTNGATAHRDTTRTRTPRASHVV